MKPCKNKIFCPASGKTKMLFETEKKAMTFLKFNKDELLEENGNIAERAYYCDVCLGWHLTSLSSFDTSSSIDLLQHKSLNATYINIESKIANIKREYKCGLYSKVIENISNIITSINTNKLIMEEEKVKHFQKLSVCSEMLDFSFAMLFAQLKNYENEELKEHIDIIDRYIDRFRFSKKKTRDFYTIAQKYKRRLKEINKET